MRPIHLLLGLVVVLASGASAFLATRLASTSNSASASNSPEVVVATLSEAGSGNAGPALEAQRAREQLAMLSSRLDAMTLELESLRNSAHREPAAAPLEPVLEVAAGSVAVSPEQRQAVLAVLAEEKAREAAEAEASRLQQEKENAQRRAARIAKELTLSPGDEARLADLMVASNSKRQELFEGMRGGNFDRDTARTQFETFRTWQTEQLSQAFGQSIADQILQTEGERFFGPGGGPGGGQGGGPGGIAGGANGRRRGNGGGQNAAGGAGGAGGVQQN